MTIKMKKLNHIKNEALTYKDCVWYMKDIDRCSLPGVTERFMTCSAHESGNMDEFCIWITKFLTSTNNDDKDNKCVQIELFDFEEYFKDEPLNINSSGYFEEAAKRIYELLEVKNNV